MNSKAMKRYVDSLIEKGDGGVAKVQIAFEPGIAIGAGGLRHYPKEDGLYELCFATQPTSPDGQPDMRQPAVVLSQVFPIDAVQSVTTKMPEDSLPESMQPSSIVTPAGAGKIIPGVH